MKTKIFQLIFLFVGTLGCTPEKRGAVDENRFENQQSINNKKIVGTWILDSAEIKPALLPLSCDSLLPGAKFSFLREGVLYVTEKASPDECGVYSYSISDNKIELLETDVLRHLELIKVDDSSLVLKSEHFPKGSYEGGSAEIQVFGYKMYFSNTNK